MSAITGSLPPNDDKSNQSTAPVESNIVTTGNLPGRRLNNPLSVFSSYTYQLSLYMVTPDAYQAFVLSGRTKINALSNYNNTGNLTSTQPNTGAFLVAQSGGINRTKDRTIPNPTGKNKYGEDLDYYIDNVKFKTYTKNGTGSSTNHTDLTFDIIEPYGFSFITHLAFAYESLRISLPAEGMLADFSKQFFILGIRFQGYNSKGLPINGPAGFMESFYDIFISKINFKLNGASTTYNIAATFTSAKAQGTAYGMVNNKTSITSVTTVAEAIAQLETALNKNTNGMVYKIQFRKDTAALQNASLINPGDLNVTKRGASGSATKSSDVNEATAVRSTPNPSARNIEFTNDIPIPQAIETIIKQSTFMSDAFNVLDTSSLTPNDKTKTNNVVNKKNNKNSIKWYNISQNITNLKFNVTTNNWDSTITYYIGNFDTPATFSGYTRPSPYMGPSKRYQYWFTGQNTEITNYSQQIDNLYYNIVLDGEGLIEPQPQGTVQVRGKRNNENRTDSIDKGTEKKNTWITSLYDPNAWAQAFITILGDPDLIMNEAANPLEDLYNQYYNPNGSINPNGSEIMIEIDFKEGVDYDKSDGLFVVNSQIMFGKPQTNSISKLNNSTATTDINGDALGTSGLYLNYQDYIKFNQQNNIQGVVYTILEVTSTFKAGQFLQVLRCTIVDRDRLNTNILSDQRTTDQTTNPVNNGITPTAGTATAQGTGFKQVQDDATGVDAQVALIRRSTPTNANNPPAVIPTNFGIVANDDSSAFSGTTQAGVAATSPQTGAASNIRPPALTPGGRIRIRGNPLDIQPI